MTRTSRQLVLLPAADWRLDEETREVGRKGVAAAREILRLADERSARQVVAERMTAARSLENDESPAA